MSSMYFVIVTSLETRWSLSQQWELVGPTLTHPRQQEGAWSSVRFGSFCDISAGLADVCSWGNSRHSAASRRSGHVSESSSEGLRRPFGTASLGNARPLPPGYSVHAFQAHIGLALGRSAPERHGTGRHSSPARPESCSVGRSLLDLAVQRGGAVS